MRDSLSRIRPRVRSPKMAATTILVLGVLLAPASAAAQTLLRLPMDCSGGASCYVTAYYDLNRTSGAIRDYTCAGKTYDNHTGTDYGVGSWAGMDAGRDIVAPADGVVTGRGDGLYDRNTSATQPPCGTSQSCGNYVRLRHADGTVTLYCHMKKDSVRVADGQTVTCGQVLGQVGSSGCSTGPHLHLGVTPSGGSSTCPYRASPLSCGNSKSFWVEQGAYLGLPGTQCQCTPNCSGRQCGGDGCGGSCGTCSAGICDAAAGRCMVDDAGLESEEPGHGEEVFAGTGFLKQWTIQNSGNTTWTSAGGYRLAFDGGERFGAPEVLELESAEEIVPGQTRVFSVEGTAPGTIGAWRGHYRMQRVDALFGERVMVEVEVTADADGDGYHAVWAGGDDCDDDDPTVYPGAPEICDGKDNDCNGLVDEDLERACDRGCGPGVETCVDGAWSCDAPPKILGRCLGFPPPPFDAGDGPGDEPPEDDCGEGSGPLEGCLDGTRNFVVTGTGCGCSAGTDGEGRAAFVLLLLLLMVARLQRAALRAVRLFSA